MTVHFNTLATQIGLPVAKHGLAIWTDHLKKPSLYFTQKRIGQSRYCSGHGLNYRDSARLSKFSKIKNNEGLAMSSSEIEIHELLKELESSLMADIQNFATLNLNQKAQIQALNSSIQSKLSQHRANTRELELCVEELDTYVDSINPLSPPLTLVLHISPLAQLPHTPCAHRLFIQKQSICSQDERQEVVTLITTHATSYNSIQRALRAAAHQQRTNAAQAASQKRSELLSGADAGVRRRQLQNDSDMVNASEGITASLRRTRQVLGEVGLGVC